MRDAIRQILAEVAGRALAAGAAPAVAVDFETFYRSPRAAKRLGAPVCAVEEQGNWAYVRQPDWEAYLVALFAPAHGAYPEICYVGPPAGAPWGALAGRTWVSHNRNFDRHVYERLVELGVVPAVRAGNGAYREWHDTADLAVYCHYPRALAKVAALRWGLALDKEARRDMDGVRWAELAEPKRARLRQYALEDAALCAAVWAEFSPQWPDWERRLSRHTGEIEFRGIPVDRARVEQHRGWLETALWRTRSRLPWVEEDDADTGRPYALRSRKALDRECLKCGVPPPRSTAQGSKEFADWLDAHGEKVPAIVELARYRRIDRALGTYRVLLSRIRPDGRAALGLKYMGAEKTGRWSGAGKFNLQNILKQPLAFVRDTFAWAAWDAARGAWVDEAGAARPAADIYIVDTRACLTASPGRKLIIPDLSQIEPRVLNWVVGNEDFLALCRAGVSPYEAHARAAMGWRPEGAGCGARDDGDGEEAGEEPRNNPPEMTGSALPLKKADPALYALAKARVLALGYGAGWQKFIEMARGYLDNEALFLAIFAAAPAAGDEAKFLSYLQWSAQRMGTAGAQEALAAWPELEAQTRAIWVNAWVQVMDFRRTNPLIAGRGKPRPAGGAGQREGVGDAGAVSWQQRREDAKAGGEEAETMKTGKVETGETKGTPAPEGLWARLEREFKGSVRSGVYTLALPSGRELKYFDVTPQWGWSCRPGNPLANPQRTYGGLLTENLCQAIGRDVFGAGLLALEDAGYEVLFHVHDEAIIDAPADADPRECIRLLTTMPGWAASLPVDSEAQVAGCYLK